MTDEDLLAIEERVNRAARGPWVTIGQGVFSFAVEVCHCESGENTPSAKEYARKDAAFIAHARTDIPALVAEVRRLRGELEKTESALKGSRCKANVMQFLWNAAEEMRSDDPVEVRLRKDLDDADEHAQKLGARIAELEAENAKLRAENERLRENI